MNEQTRYQPILKCRSCGMLRNDHPHDADFENAFKRRRFCIDCGGYAGWDDVQGYWVSQAIWWNPLSWFDGELVEAKP